MSIPHLRAAVAPCASACNPPVASKKRVERPSSSIVSISIALGRRGEARHLPRDRRWAAVLVSARASRGRSPAANAAGYAERLVGAGTLRAAARYLPSFIIGLTALPLGARARRTPRRRRRPARRRDRDPRRALVARHRRSREHRAAILRRTRRRARLVDPAVRHHRLVVLRSGCAARAWCSGSLHGGSALVATTALLLGTSMLFGARRDDALLSSPRPSRSCCSSISSAAPTPAAPSLRAQVMLFGTTLALGASGDGRAPRSRSRSYDLPRRSRHGTIALLVERARRCVADLRRARRRAHLG